MPLVLNLKNGLEIEMLIKQWIEKGIWTIQQSERNICNKDEFKDLKQTKETKLDGNEETLITFKTNEIIKN